MSEKVEPPASPSQEEAADRTLEIWLEHRLRWLHGAVLREPIPPELLRILEEKTPRR